jgi:DtxR family Mn-dependent transcriptional regulator
MLTTTQEDYIEAVYRIALEKDGIRVSDLAARLGCRLPTVTRTVKSLTAAGWLQHESRGLVRLSRQGRQVAEQLVRRHGIVVRFLTVVLGLSPEAADRDACRLEHGLSPSAADRLLAWLEHMDRLEPAVREAALEYAGRAGELAQEFSSLPEASSFGWRG